MKKTLIFSLIAVLGLVCFWILMRPQNGFYSLQSEPVAFDETKSKSEGITSDTLLKTGAPSKQTEEINDSFIDSDDLYNSHIVDCPVAGLYDQEEGKIYAQATQMYFASMEHSSDKEKRLAYAFFANTFNPQEGIQSKLSRLLQFKERFKDDPSVDLAILGECAKGDLKTECKQTLLNDIVETHKNNGAMWLKLAMLFAKQENDDGLMFAVDEMLKSPFHKDDYISRIKTYNNVIVDMPQSNKPINRLSSILTSFMSFPNYHSLTTWCKDTSKSIVRQELCIELGRYLEVGTTTSFDRAIGFAIQGIVYTQIGKTEKAKEIEAKGNKYSISVKIQRGRQNEKAFNLMAWDDKLFATWLANFNQFGELEAANMNLKEAVELSKYEYYKPCED